MTRSILSLLKPLITRRLIKTYFWILLFLVTGIGLFYIIENWRGARAYQKAKEAYLEQGGTLDLSDILPPRVEPEDNFCALPVVRNLEEGMKPFNDIWSVAPERRTRSKELLLKRREAKPNWKLWGVVEWNRTALDEIRWDHAAYWMRDALGWIPEDSELSPIEQVSLALRRFDPLISQLAVGIDRPHSQFIPQLDQQREGKLLQEISGSQWPTVSAITLLQLRGLAAAMANHGDIVFESLSIMTKFQQALSNQVRLLEFSNALRSIGRMEVVLHAALRNRILTSSQLEDLQNRFSRMAIIQQVDRVMKTELMSYLELWEYLKTAGYEDLRLWNGGKAPSWKLRLAPAGWWDSFKADLLRNGLCGQPSSPLKLHTGWPPDLRPLHNRTRPWPIKKHQMEIACALERYYLDHSTYPESLQALVPTYLSAVPIDIDYQPMRYQQTTDGRYAIYSVGFDLKDDGGKAIGTKPFREDYKGDWTWRY